MVRPLGTYVEDPEYLCNPWSRSISKTVIMVFNRNGYVKSKKKYFILLPELRGSRPTRPAQSLPRRVGCECAQMDLAATSDRNSKNYQWKQAGCGSGFSQNKPDPGLWTPNERFFWMILDNFKFLLFCFHTFGVRRYIDVLRFRKPAWIRIRIHSIRIQGSKVYKGRLTPKVWKQKRRLKDYQEY